MDSLFKNWKWQPPPHWSKITTIELHTGGEPLRVITSGLPPIEGRTVLEKRRYFREHFDHLRKGLMWEPRGHADMYGAVVLPSADADMDVFFMHNEGYSTMCGHATLAITKLALETGLVSLPDGRSELAINVPAGRIRAKGVIRDGKVVEASFQNVPSFVYLRDGEADVPGVGRVRFDIAYGGAFYAFVEAQSVGVRLVPEEFNRLIDVGRRIKRTVMAQFPIHHPFEKDLSFQYGTILTGPAENPGHHSRNVCIFAEGEVDRSATGSGVSARAALHHAKGELRLGEKIVIESILGTTMTVQAVESLRYGPHEAVIPEVSGSASIVGRHEFYFDPEDPLRNGFIFR